MTVIATGGTEKGRSSVSEQGAHHVLDHHAADYLDQLMELTDGKGVNVILEMLANVNLDKDLTVMSRHGRVVIIGNRGRIEIDPRAAMTRDLNILGMTLFNTSDEDRASIHAGLVAGLENGTLKPIVGKEMTLADAPRAHEAVLQPGALGKIVLIP
jgi:NADPH2:quinone reductase